MVAPSTNSSVCRMFASKKPCAPPPRLQHGNQQIGIVDHLHAWLVGLRSWAPTSSRRLRCEPLCQQQARKEASPRRLPSLPGTHQQVVHPCTQAQSSQWAVYGFRRVVSVTCSEHVQRASRWCPAGTCLHVHGCRLQVKACGVSPTYLHHHHILRCYRVAPQVPAPAGTQRCR